MKNSTAKPDKESQRQLTAADDTAEIEWFKQFDNMPGIQDVYSPAELGKMKETMFTTIRNEINKIG